MPIYFRLPGASIIIAVGIGLAVAWTTTSAAESGTATPAAVQTPVADSELHESIGTNFPFNPHNVPSASVDSPATTTAPGQPPGKETHKAPIVESPKVANNQCANPADNRLQKSMLITAFPRFNPGSANAGELFQAEHQVPALLSQQLVNRRSAITPVQLMEGLSLPSTSNDTQLAMQTQRLANNHHSQLVVSGEILDMSMANADATYNPSLYRRFINSGIDLFNAKPGFDKRDRLFSFQLHVRDGFTGQLLFTRRYDTYGIWKETRPVGFGSAPFWKTDYGQQIKGLIKKAALDVGDVIECQPFIAQIDSRPGQTQVILQGGANNGLHAGDTLALYQLVIEGSENRYQEHDVRLVNRNTTIELREVYPSHSVAVINSTSYLMGQYLAVAP